MRRKSGEQLQLSDVLTAHRDTWIQYKEAHNERVNAHYHTDALILYSQKLYNIRNGNKYPAT